MSITLGDVSPLAGMLTGKGALGEAIRDGLGGLIPQAIARNAYADEETKKQVMAHSAANMKKGGSVSSASKRADGIAQRGKTRGRMV